MYKLNYNRLLTQLTLTPLRKPKFLAMLRVLCGDIAVLHADFLQLRQKALYEAAHGSQIIYLQKYLNDRFSLHTRKIKVIDGQELTPNTAVFYLQQEAVVDNAVLYTHAEGNSHVLYQWYEYTKSADFVVQIDNTLGDCNPNLAELRAVIEQRKLPGITYDINIIIN